MSSSSKFLMLLSPSSPLLHHRPSSSIIRLSRRRFPVYFHNHYLSLPRPSVSSNKTRKNSPFLPLKPSSRHLNTQSASANFANSAVWTPIHHPWSEFSGFLNNLSGAGYFNSSHTSNEFGAYSSHFPEEVLDACLVFARDRADLLRMLSKKEIEVLVQNGTPFLFKDGEDSAMRLRAFLDGGEANIAEVDKANMVDLMKFLLSYASNAASSSQISNLYNRELVESSVQYLFGELAKLSDNLKVSNYSGYQQTQPQDRYGQVPRSFGQNIEMKRGDWICPRCNFMNFARNVKCLECEEARPKRQLTGGEWECPQCDFYNYGRNTVCLRCDCKRPGEISPGNTYSRPGLTYSNQSSLNEVDINRRLAANEEKAQRWFSKVSQLDSASDMSSAIADEDFPEVMPLRKGVNRFVVSTRKTPLERRLANVQYRRNMENDSQAGGENMKVDRSLDEILGRSSTPSESKHDRINNGAENSLSNSTQDGYSRGSNSSYVPFVPLPADMFAKKPESSNTQENPKDVLNDQQSVVSNAFGRTDTVSNSEELNKSPQQSVVSNAFGRTDTVSNSEELNKSPESQQFSESSDKELEQGEKSEGWFKKVAELHSANPDVDFPNIMPMRKGENRFVVSKKKDRSLTSTYKRRAAMEQASNTNYVPFVPFPPDYFAKKDKQQPEGTDSCAKATNETLSEGSMVEGKQQMQHEQTECWRSKPSGENLNEMRRDATYTATNSGYSNQNSIDRQTTNDDNLSSGYSLNDGRQHTTNSTGSSAQPSKDQNIGSTWTGKSLEGSAVKEPDPLDMSEEAKAERWFRRVAQIKDISELSQIPDEDFPSIMPMRKGVNRFVVSKRKTPLERRLASQQYRSKLPNLNSESGNKESEES